MKLILLILVGIVLLSSLMAFLSGPFALCYSSGDVLKCDVYNTAGPLRHVEIYPNGTFYVLYNDHKVKEVFRCVNCNQSSAVLPDVRGIVIMQGQSVVEAISVYRLSLLAVYTLAIPLALNILAVVKVLQGRLYGLYQGLKYASWSSYMATMLAVVIFPLSLLPAFALGLYGVITAAATFYINRRLRRWVKSLLT